jgi:hypothetical protein
LEKQPPGQEASASSGESSNTSDEKTVPLPAAVSVIVGVVVCIIGFLLATREGAVTINIEVVGVGIENATGGTGLIVLGLAMIFLPFILRALGWQRHTWLGLGMLIGVTLVLGISIMASSEKGKPGEEKVTAPPEVAITSLQAGQQAPMMMDTVRGTSKNLSSGQEIWLVVVVHGSGRLYPQEGPVPVQADGDWTSPSVFLGVKKDSGKKFDILAVLTTQEAGSAFARHLEEGYQTGNYPGLQRLPAGAVEYDRVTVIRE